MRCSARGHALLLTIALSGVTLTLRAQDHAHAAAPVALQPLAQQARRVETTLAFLGQPLTPSERQAIDGAVGMADETEAAARLQQILDAHVIAHVHVNAESRVKVEQGNAKPELVQGGTRLFLVKVVNEGGVTAPLTVQSPNGERVYIPSWSSGLSPEPKQQITDADVRDRWAQIALYTGAPMRSRLSGLTVEYAILQIYSRDAGQRSATLAFNVGQGTQDIGFRDDVDIVFTAVPAHQVRVRVVDEQGKPATASFLIKDDADRVYPSAIKRLAPDFYFQPQIYRADGQTISLPAGSFKVIVTRGPEYTAEARRIAVAGPDE